MAMVAGKKPPASTPYLAQRRDGALLLTIGCSTRYWLDPFVKVKSSLWVKKHGPSDRELANKTTNWTRYVWTSQRTEAGALFDNYPRLKKKTLLPDIAIVNPCAGSNLGNAARHVG